MPRPKKPLPLKKLLGTYRPDRDGLANPVDVLPPIPEAPPPPAWLKDPVAVAEWQRLAGMMTVHHLLTETSLSPLAMLCALLGKLVKDARRGRMPSAALLAQYRALCGDFGCTPVSLAKLPSPGVYKSDNPFARNGVRPAGDNPFAKFDRHWH
jgi:phage terminase small subunit